MNRKFFTQDEYKTFIPEPSSFCQPDLFSDSEGVLYLEWIDEPVPLLKSGDRLSNPLVSKETTSEKEVHVFAGLRIITGFLARELVNPTEVGVIGGTV